MMKRMIRLVLMLCAVGAFMASTAWAQQQTSTIQGTVTNQQNGNSIIGANVYIKALKRGAASDQNGNYTIDNVPYGTYSLRVTYIGYATKTVQVTVDQPTENVDLTLSHSVANLQNTVVTAYGVTQQRNQLPYSAQSVDASEVQNSGTGNYISSLSGRVSGLDVQTNAGLTGSSKIILRGHSSLSGSNQALIVVDGVPYVNKRFNTNDFGAGYRGADYGNTGLNLDADNIESITVLKGASAAALYGQRASNGAILVETKKGTPGQKVQVTLSNSVGVSMYDHSTFPTYQREYGAGYVGGFLRLKSPFKSGPDTVEFSRLPADASFGPKFDPNKMVYQWDSIDPNSPNYAKQEPWTAAPKGHMAGAFLKRGSNVRNSLQINGGIANGGYYSLGYSQSFKRGILPNSKNNENNLNFSAGYNISPKLEAEGSIKYNRRYSKGIPHQGYNSLFSQFRQWNQTNVDYTTLKDAFFRNRDNVNWNYNANFVGNIFWNNPYYIQYVSTPTFNFDRYVGRASLKYDVTDWFNLTGRGAFDTYHALRERRTGVQSVGSPGNYNRLDDNYTEYNFYLLGNYKKQLTDKIQIYGVVGGQIRRDITNNIYASTTGGLAIPGLFSLQNSVNKIPFPTENEIILGVNSEFAQFNLNYNDFINLKLTGRRDKASSLPKDSNVYYYPSVSAGFTFSHFLSADWLSIGKVRGSYSSVGHTAPALSLKNTYNRPNNFGSAALFDLPANQNNPNLKPEKKKSWEVGLQLGFFNNRVLLDGSYYKTNTLDEAVPVPVSNASGYDNKFINAGNIQNRGLEMTLRARPVASRTFNWNFTINWSKNENKIKELAPGVSYYQFINPQGGGVNIGAKVNGTYGAIRGYDFVYNDKGQKLVDDDGFYEITPGANNVIGNVQPNWSGGITNTFNYKNFSLSFLVDVRSGGDIFSLDQWYGQGTGLYPITAGLNAKGNPKRDPVSEGGGILLNGVHEDGSPNNTYIAANGGFGYYSRPSADYVYDGSYVKLRQASFSYDLPKAFITKSGLITGASVTLEGNNLWIIHKNIPYADPEQTVGDPNIQGGYSGGNLPAIRNITLKLQLKF